MCCVLHILIDFFTEYWSPGLALTFFQLDMTRNYNSEEKNGRNHGNDLDLSGWPRWIVRTTWKGKFPLWHDNCIPPITEASSFHLSIRQIFLFTQFVIKTCMQAKLSRWCAFCHQYSWVKVLLVSHGQLKWSPGALNIKSHHSKIICTVQQAKSLLFCRQ